MNTQSDKSGKTDKHIPYFSPNRLNFIIYGQSAFISEKIFLDRDCGKLKNFMLYKFTVKNINYFLCTINVNYNNN